MALRKDLLPIPFVIAFLCTVWFLTPPRGEEAKKFLSPPPEYIEHFHLGFKESMADSLWLRWIQDSDFCQTYFESKKNEPLADERKANDDLLLANPRHKICDSSWGFKMLDAITRLDPRFLMPYMAGAVTLSVLVEDYEGASILFDRGLQYYPNDWKLLYRAAYHYQFDKKDLPKAAATLIRAGENGAPPWVISLASRLYTRAGQIELGISTLEAFKKFAEGNKEAVEKIDKRIAELKAQLDK